MSVEFRQRTLGEYARLAWDSKWLILLPTIAVALAVAYVVYRLPNVYESRTLVVVKPPTIPNSVVPSLSDSDITLRLNTITQLVMSRSKLEPIIERNNLYQEERARGESKEALIDKMRANIAVNVDTSRNDIANAFRITFRGREPRSVARVTGDLASEYTRAQTTDVQNTTTQTKEFFEQQMNDATAKLKEIDNRRLQYMQQHLNVLPTGTTALLGQLEGMRGQQAALITEIGRMRDQRAALNTQTGELQRLSEQDRGDYIDAFADPKSTPAYAILVQRKSQLEAEYQSMLTTLTPKNPDVMQKKAEIDSVQRNMDGMITDHRIKVEERRQKMLSREDPRLNSLRLNMQMLDKEIARQQKNLDQSSGQIAALEARLNQVPGTEVGLQSLNREYDTEKSRYDSLLQSVQRIDLATDVARNAQGESIQVIDPANLPTEPVAPKRPMLMGMGLALGLGLGLLLAVLRALPGLLRIQSAKDAEHYTGLPVLAAVPQMLTAREKMRMRVRRTALAVGGVVITLVSIPALIFLIRVTRVFDRFTV